MLRLDRISKIYPNGEALKDISWEVKNKERIGLVGANGCGKTTQFKIITGEIEPTTGQVFLPKGARIAYLSQEFDFIQENTVRDELLRAFDEAYKIQMKLHEVQHQLETAQGDELDRAIRRLTQLQQEFEHIDGYALERKVDKILPEIGFSSQDADRLVSTFSGGWQVRIGFGKVMLRQPDLLLLDEPTNHIDIETIEWLEEYLTKQEVPMVIVSHDRQFLDKICTKIVEIEFGVSTTYAGNYTYYVTTKEETKLAQQSAYERQQEELAKQQVFIDRFRASATRSTQAKSREKQLEKIELIEEPDEAAKVLRFKFPPCPRSGKTVAEVKELTHAYGDNILFMGANLEIERGDKIALIGPNGAGKSTLLRFLMGKEKPDEGVVKLGDHNIYPAYFEQNQAEALDLNKTLLATIADEVHNWKDSEIRGLLGRFLFGQDSVFKYVRELSGGEKARLALAKMLTGTANFLVLDEPTNHLDIPAKETLEDALRNFDGAVVVVSHDRYFISKVANKIIEIEDGDFKVYPSNYEYYLEKKAQEKAYVQSQKEKQEHEAYLAEKRAKQKAKEQARRDKR